VKTRLALVAVTALNLVLALFSFDQSRAGEAQDVAPVLRGRALEIVDDAGRVRASIRIIPADPDFEMPDGSKGYPETVLLRLIDSKGQPNVKIEASDRGAGQLLGGEEDPTFVQILAHGPSTSLKLSNGDGRERSITP